jgi:ribonuclease BN (tRNA processing enzyme)
MLAEGLEALQARIGNGDDRLMAHWLRAHTLASDAARTAAEAGVSALALHHLIPSDDPAFGPDDWQRACAPFWQGPLHLGRDGLRIRLGNPG